MTMSVTRHLAVVAFVAAGIHPSSAQDTAAHQGPHRRFIMHAARLAGSIRLDGVLDEAAWQNAPGTSEFMQSYPQAGGKPTDSTRVRVLYDDEALYVGIRAYDSDPRQIAAQLARRDASGIYSDWLIVMLGTYHDRRTAFRFSVNPLGVKQDRVEYNDNQEDANWDAVWEVGTTVDSLGWTAEFRIPFSQLRFPAKEPEGGRVWDIQIMRDVARRQERDSWAPWTQQSPGFVSAFGEIDGLNGIPAPTRLEMLPYVSARDTRAPGTRSNPFFRSNDSRFALGGDVRYGLQNGLTVTGTVNPDFGQVEVDPAVVNLSAFETFFPEKRPFFLEGSDLFNFGSIRTNNDYNSQYFFYSRRIGRQPERTLGSTYVDAPDQTTILGATKLTGRVGSWAIGGLDAVTGEQRARYFNSPTDEGTAPIEPLTNYLVGRVRRDINGGNGFVGGMLTGTTRALNDSVLGSQLRRGAYFAGVDFEQAWANRSWIMTGFGSASRVDGSAQAIALTQRSSSRYYQRPDASYVHYDSTRTSLEGYMGEVSLLRNGAVNGSLSFKEVSPGYEINDLGFQSRTDYRVGSTEVGYTNQEPGTHLRNYDGLLYTTHAFDYGNDLIFGGYGVAADAQLNNLWQFGGSATLTQRAYDARLTRGGPTMRVPFGQQATVYLTSDSRWPVTGTLQVSDNRTAAGDDSRSYSLTLDARPASYVHLSLGPSLSQVYNTQQYVASVADPFATATYGRRYVFATLHQTTLSLDTRIDWTFTPDLTLQLYAQPFVSAGRYTAFKELRAPRTDDFDVYGRNAGTIAYDPANSVYDVDPDGASPAAGFTIANPDFNVRSLHGDAVLRWEYRPGSTLYVVWQQERSGFDPGGDFELRRDTNAIFRSQPTNTFLVKCAYWIGK